jgi:NADH:ubiquinone oxidoreductase subunit K
MIIIKINIYILLISFSLMFWVFNLNLITIGFSLGYYLFYNFTHVETLIIFPISILLYKTLHPKSKML